MTTFQINSTGTLKNVDSFVSFVDEGREISRMVSESIPRYIGGAFQN